MMKLTRVLLAAAAIAVAVIPCAGQSPVPPPEQEKFQLRIGDDVTIAPGETAGTIVVIDGNLVVRGDAHLIIVIDGTVDVANATIGDLVLISGRANLDRGSIVMGSVQTVQSVVLRDPESVVQGSVRNDSGFLFGKGLAALGILFGIGYSLALLVAAALFAALFPRVAREASVTMTHEVAKSALGAFSLWIVIPIAAMIFAMTIVGIPFAVGLLIFVLPTLAFIGYLVAGVRLGGLILSRTRSGATEERPYVEALVGMLILIAASWIPGIGGIVTLLAFLGGSGALAVIAWRAMREHEPIGRIAPSGPAGVATMN